MKKILLIALIFAVSSAMAQNSSKREFRLGSGFSECDSIVAKTGCKLLIAPDFNPVERELDAYVEDYKHDGKFGLLELFFDMNKLYLVRFTENTTYKEHWYGNFNKLKEASLSY